MDWSSKKISVHVDIVKSVQADEFPGLYALNFSNQCWSLDDKRIIVSTEWKRTRVLYF